MKKFVLCVMLAGCVAACESAPTGDEYGIEGGAVNEFGKSTFGATDAPEVAPGKASDKADRLTGRAGLPADIDNAASSVWEVRNAWEDKSTPAAREAGMAWGRDSGLTWEQKFEKWVDSLERTSSDTSSGRETYTLTTPWGVTLPSPSLECAEAAIFLRVAFSAWHGLPFYLEASDAESGIYFGHFGMRRTNGKFARTPDFKTRYDDFTAQAESVRDGGAWPSDSSLAGKSIPGTSDDAQPMIGSDAHTGAYFDRVFLNKRVGHFLITTLAYFGSIHLADSRNTFNVAPEKLKSGDVLVKRWQRSGIGHVYLVLNADVVGEVEGSPRYEVELASGSMPRRQPVWESANTSMRNFTSNHAGGPGFADFGGGLKRWRIAKVVDGRWTNVVSSGSSSAWINSNDTDAIAQRTSTFSDVLRQLSREEKRATLLEVIESNRAHLRRFPASCAARIRREEAFTELYDLMETEFNLSARQVDEDFRALEDYVFAELVYDQSKTCCWNSSNSDMYEIAMNLNESLQADAQACMDIVVFKNRDDAGDGFDLFREHAASLGREDQWRTWSADESCPQSEVAADTEVENSVTPYCSLSEQPAAGATTTHDFVDAQTSIPDNDSNGVSFEVEVEQDGDAQNVSLDVLIQHTYRGDLEIEVVHPSGARATVKSKSWDGDDDVDERYTVDAFQGLEARGSWTLIVRDLLSQDTGAVQRATLTIAR